MIRGPIGQIRPIGPICPIRNASAGSALSSTSDFGSGSSFSCVEAGSFCGKSEKLIAADRSALPGTPVIGFPFCPADLITAAGPMLISGAKLDEKTSATKKVTSDNTNSELDASFESAFFTSGPLRSFYPTNKLVGS